MTFSKDRCQVLHLGQTTSMAAGTAWGTALQRSTSQGLAKHNPAARRAERWSHRSTASWCRGAIPLLPETTGRGQHLRRDLPVQDRHQETGVSSVKGHLDGHRLEHLPCENWACWAPSACRRDGFGMRTKIAACCYLQGCYQENRTRLFSEVQGRRKKELKKTNVKSC